MADNVPSRLVLLRECVPSSIFPRDKTQAHSGEDLSNVQMASGSVFMTVLLRDADRTSVGVSSLIYSLVGLQTLH